MTLMRREKLTDSIESFFFESEVSFEFLPGQFLEWSVPHPSPDTRGIKRWFTIASSPTEKLIQLTTRFADPGSSFKRALRSLKQGEQLWANGLEGDFTLPNNPKTPLVFIAGGIGITPFRSMIQCLIDKEESRDVTLVYAAKTVRDLIFLDVCEKARLAFGLKTITVISEGDVPPMNISGTIDKDLLAREVPSLATAQIYISGPEPMVESLSQIIRELGASNNAIHQDFFPGYLTSDVTAADER
jgi:ferredoxin-NADP reductase